MKPPPASRNEIAALRGLAIRTLATACPHLPKTDIARVLGVDHGTVRFHLSGRCKSSTVPFSLQRSLISAATAIASGNFSAASSALIEASGAAAAADCIRAA
jgi:hypothetical protein